jgi:hypothetical protein
MISSRGQYVVYRKNYIRSVYIQYYIHTFNSRTFGHKSVNSNGKIEGPSDRRRSSVKT